MIEEAERLIREGYAVKREGNQALALDRYQAAVQALHGAAEPLRLAHTIRHVADIQRQMGQLEQAKTNYAEALRIYRAEPSTETLDLANTLRGFALLLEDGGNLPAARTMWDEAHGLYTAVGVQEGVDEALKRLAAL